MIDWNAPIYVRDTGAQVFVCGKEIGARIGDHGECVIVQNRRGEIMHFYPCGTPIAHLNFLTNDGMHQYPVRTRLAQIIHLRALQMLGLDEQAMEQHANWGMF